LRSSRPTRAISTGRTELDLRFGKVLKAGRTRSIVSFDLYNTLNTDKPISVNKVYNSWLAPTAILNPRLAKNQRAVRLLTHCAPGEQS